MRVKMRAWLTGETKSGGPWPSTGGVIDLDDDEASELVAKGLAVALPVEPDTGPEPAPAPKPDPEPPAAKPAKTSRATRKTNPSDKERV